MFSAHAIPPAITASMDGAFYRYIAVSSNRVTSVANEIRAPLMETIAQPAKALKQQLIGTWDQVVSEVTTPDGKKSLPFEEKPNGMLIFA